MSTRDPYDDDSRHDGYDDVAQPPRRRRWWSRASARKPFNGLRVPGFMLQLYGAFLIACAVAIGTISLISPESLINPYFDWVENMQAQQPPAQRQQLPPRDDAIKSLQIEGPIYGVVALIVGLVAFIGGAKMPSPRLWLGHGGIRRLNLSGIVLLLRRPVAGNLVTDRVDESRRQAFLLIVGVFRNGQQPAAGRSRVSSQMADRCRSKRAAGGLALMWYGMFSVLAAVIGLVILLVSPDAVFTSTMIW